MQNSGNDGAKKALLLTSAHYTLLHTAEELQQWIDRATKAGRVAFDTETTGLDPNQGHRIIEFAGLEMEGRKLVVNEARPKAPRSDFGGDRGGDRRGGFGEIGRAHV